MRERLSPCRLRLAFSFYCDLAGCNPGYQLPITDYQQLSLTFHLACQGLEKLIRHLFSDGLDHAGTNRGDQPTHLHVGLVLDLRAAVLVAELDFATAFHPAR